MGKLDKLFGVNKKPIKIRRSWKINPRIRIKPSKKVYKRACLKKEEKESLEETESL